MEIVNIILIVLLIIFVNNHFNSKVKEHMDITHIQNMGDLREYTNIKFPHYKKNQTYIDKIEKPHKQLDNFFTFKNHNQEDYECNKLTTSEIENNYFFKNFNSSILIEKSKINPLIDDFSESRYYVKNINKNLNIIEDLNSKYTNEGVINGGFFMNNLTGMQDNYKKDLSTF